MSKLRINNLLTISRFSLICYTTFFILSILGRFLFPAGDEPDYGYRVSEVIDDIDSTNYFHPYHYLSGLLQNIPLNPDCQIITSPLQLTSDIIGSECINQIDVILNRFFLTFFTTLVFILPTIFREISFKIFSSIGLRISCEDYNFRCDVISISTVLPSSIYYLGLVSNEQFVYCLIFTSFLLMDSWLIILLLLWGLTIDFGNDLVFAGFVLFSYLAKYLYQRFGLYIAIAYFFLTAVIAYGVGSIALAFLGRFFPYFSTIFNDYGNLYFLVYDKYPVFLRPVVAFISFAFMTSESIKPVILVYLFIGIIFIFNLKLSFTKLKQISRLKQTLNPKDSSQDQLIFEYLGYLASIIYITATVFIFPGFGNYKYYLFFSPFFTAVTIRNYQKSRQNSSKYKFSILLFFISMSILVFLSLSSLYMKN